MKKSTIRLTRLLAGILVYSILGTPSAASASEGIKLYEVGILTGYHASNLKFSDDDMESIPFRLHVGYDINSLVNLEEHPGTLQFAFEPFVDSVTTPGDEFMMGMGFYLKYDYPLWDRFSLFTEIGSGPMYLSFATVEQGQDGFNFLSQAGGGMQIRLADNTAVSLGYRFQHISHAEIRDGANAGIDGHAYMAGFSFLY